MTIMTTAKGGADDGEADGSLEDNHNDDNNNNTSSLAAQWVANPCIMGHFQSMDDMAWDQNGKYLLRVSSNQTSPLWAEVPTSLKKEAQ